MHRICIEAVSRGVRGKMYRVAYRDSVLIESSRNPEFDACRVLLALGITSTLVSGTRERPSRPCASIPERAPN